MLRFACLSTLLFLIACSPNVTPDDPASPALDSTEAGRVVPERPLTAADLAAACDGRPVERAAAYAEADTLHRAVILIRDSTDAPYRMQTYSSSLPDEWMVTSTAELDQAQVALCVTRFPGAFARTCEFFPSDSTGQPDESAEPRLLDLHAASYAVSVRIPSTGEERLALGLDAAVHTCPILHTFGSDGGRERDYALPPFHDLRDRLVPVIEPNFDPYRIFSPEERARMGV